MCMLGPTSSTLHVGEPVGRIHRWDGCTAVSKLNYFQLVAPTRGRMDMPVGLTKSGLGGAERVDRACVATR